MCCFKRSFYLFGSLWVFPPSPLPCPVALREVAQQQGRRLNTSYLTDKNHIIKEGLKTPPLCGASHIGKVARSDGGVENSISSAGLYWSFNPLARWALPLYRYAAQGERFESVASNILNSSIAVPRSFMEYFCFHYQRHLKLLPCVL